MTQLQARSDLGVHARFEPPTSAAHPNVNPPYQQPAEAPSAPIIRKTLHDELRQAEQQSAHLAAQEQRLIDEAHTLARQRDELAARKAECEAKVAESRDARVQALLSGAEPAKSAATAAAIAAHVETIEAIAVAQVDIVAREKANETARVNLHSVRASHELKTNDIQWRIALAKYAVGVRDLMPLAEDLATLARVHSRSFVWGQGLVLNARGGDIAGIPLAAALELAANLGEPEEVLQ